MHCGNIMYRNEVKYDSKEKNVTFNGGLVRDSLL